MIRILIVIILFVFGGIGTVLAETNNWGYGPFLNGHEWPCIPIVTYVQAVSNIWTAPTNSKNSPSITERLEDDSDDFTTVILRFPDGRTFKTYNNFVLGPYLSAVYSGDFNNDGKSDFLIIKPTGMNGIGGWNCIGVFAFSQGDDYLFTRVYSWGLGPESLAIDPQTKSFRFIHTSFVQGTGIDGKDHSFWVHRFFQWTGGSFEPDETLMPIWIQFLERSNHDPTKLLTPELKKQIWSENREQNANIEW
ncbi:MAG TPA: hypothetical protein VGN23_15345 [Verrucomicrobiae bacterium]|jgi:hypothetical protein